MIPSHGLVSPIRTPHERAANNHDDQLLCIGRRGPPEDARIAALSPAACTKQSSFCCGDPSGVSPKRAGGSSSKIRSPPPVLRKIPTLPHATPAWIKGEVSCFAASQQRGAMDPPSSEELVSAKEECRHKIPIPAWKQKLLERKNAKPDFPSWKQKLMEKKRAEGTAAAKDPPWKRELAAKKREQLEKSEASLQMETDDAHGSPENEGHMQSSTNCFLTRTEAEDRVVEDTTLYKHPENCISMGLDPPDITEIIQFVPTFAEKTKAVNDTDDDTGDDNVDSSTCSHDSTDKAKASSFSGNDSGLEAFLEDASPMKACPVTATTTSSSSSSTSETSGPERSREEPKSALETELAAKEFSEEDFFYIENDESGLIEAEHTQAVCPAIKNSNDSEHSDSDDGFDDPSDSDDDSASIDDWGNRRSNGFSFTTSPACEDSDKQTESTSRRRPKRRKARRYALPLCDDYSSDGDEDVLPPGVTTAVVPPMEFEDFSKEDFSATTDEETLFLADHYKRQRSVVKTAIFSDEPTKDDFSPLLVEGEFDGDKKKHKNKKKRTKASTCSGKMERSKKRNREPSERKDEGSGKKKATKGKKRSKEKGVKKHGKSHKDDFEEKSDNTGKEEGSTTLFEQSLSSLYGTKSKKKNGVDLQLSASSLQLSASSLGIASVEDNDNDESTADPHQSASNLKVKKDKTKKKKSKSKSKKKKAKQPYGSDHESDDDDKNDDEYTADLQQSTSNLSMKTDKSKKTRKGKSKKKLKSADESGSKKKKITLPDESVDDEERSVVKVKLDSHYKKHKKKSTKSSTCSVKTEKSKKGKDSARSKTSKKNEAKKEKKEGEKKTKKSTKDKKGKSEHVRLQTMASF